MRCLPAAGPRQGGRGRRRDLGSGRARTHTLTDEHPEGYLRLARARLRRTLGQSWFRPCRLLFALGLFRFLSPPSLSHPFCAALPPPLSRFAWN